MGKMAYKIYPIKAQNNLESLSKICLIKLNCKENKWLVIDFQKSKRSTRLHGKDFRGILQSIPKELMVRRKVLEI